MNCIIFSSIRLDSLMQATMEVASVSQKILSDICNAPSGTYIHRYSIYMLHTHGDIHKSTYHSVCMYVCMHVLLIFMSVRKLCVCIRVVFM
jgi:hypothetical protein